MKKLALALAIVAGLAAALAPADARERGHGWGGGAAYHGGRGWGLHRSGWAPYESGWDGSYYRCSGWSYGRYIGGPCSGPAHFWDPIWW